MIQMQINVPQALTRPLETAGGHVIFRDALDPGSGNTSRRVRPTCTDCNKDFLRVQELKRHLKDIHEPRRQCPFCGFMWTRPNNIKVHLLAKHRDNFTAELLVTIQAMRGQMIAKFLDSYNQGYGLSGLEVAFHSSASWAWISPILIYRRRLRCTPNCSHGARCNASHAIT